MPMRHKNDSPCFLYGLLDPRTQTIFYVGVSRAPFTRMAHHRCDPASSAFLRVQEIMAAGFKCEVKVLHECVDRIRAYALERKVIAQHPGLVNSYRYHNKPFDIIRAALAEVPR